MPYVDNQGVKIHYKVKGQGIPLLLQHGGGARIETWAGTGYTEVLQQKFKLILVDARGHGASDKPYDTESYTLSLRVSDIVAILDDLNIEKAHYWGYSMGGWIGFGMAKYASNRIASLVIGGAHPYTDSAGVRAFQNVDGTDSDAFISAFESFAGVHFPPEIRGGSETG